MTRPSGLPVFWRRALKPSIKSCWENHWREKAIRIKREELGAPSATVMAGPCTASTKRNVKTYGIYPIIEMQLGSQVSG